MDRQDERRDRGPAAAAFPVTEFEGGRGAGVHIDAEGLTRRVRTGATVLNGVSLSVEPGELVAIAGGSGAGKTTLLEALAGVQRADEGTVRFDGAELYGNTAAWRRFLGYVPQDDIIHPELPLARTLRYAARLRLPADATQEEVDDAVRRALRALDLAEREDVPVRALSGGQRKRASIAVELLTRPRVFFLDEPTSGLDPATGAELLRVLRGLAAAGATVVFTTHEEWATGFRQWRGEGVAMGTEPTPSPIPPDGLGEQGSEVGPLRQWWVLTQRIFETLVRNPLTMAILVGSPVMVVAMFTILFRPGAFDVEDPEPSALLMILFWITFAAFFFGITYGLLQIVTERAILRREHLGGVRLSPYLLSKAAVLLPFLLAINALMLIVLRALNRLPGASLIVYLSVGGTLGLLAVAALALGLLTSAGVTNPSQATLALPLLSFPAVLFSGAILPVHIMAGVGKGISLFMPVRWAFEAVGHDLGIRQLLLEGGSSLGPPLVASYGDAGLHSTGFYWAILATFIVIFLLAARLLLQRSARRSLR